VLRSDGLTVGGFAATVLWPIRYRAFSCKSSILTNPQTTTKSVAFVALAWRKAAPPRRSNGKDGWFPIPYSLFPIHDSPFAIDYSL
jgi:hypothetical protein